MKTIIMLALAFSGLYGSGFASDQATGYSQRYVIFIDGERAGKEIVTESINENGDRIAESESEIYFTDGLETNRTAFTTRMVLDEKSLKPKSYVYRHVAGGSGDFYEVRISGDEITRTLNRGGETSVQSIEFKPDMVILDYNVFHQYDYLIHKYDNKKGGKQVFSDYIPPIGTDIPIALTYIGTSELKTMKGPLPVKNYQVDFIRRCTVTTDNNGRLVQLKMPDQNLEVIREDLVPANR